MNTSDYHNLHTVMTVTLLQALEKIKPSQVVHHDALHARTNKTYEIPPEARLGANDVFQFAYNIKGTSLQKINDHWYVTKPGDLTVFQREDTFCGRHLNADIPYERLHIYSLAGHRMGVHIDSYENGQHTLYQGVNLTADDELLEQIDRMRDELRKGTPQSCFTRQDL